MFGYAIVLLITSNLFRPLYVENFLYGFIAAVLIYILNKTVKPFLVTISLPLIGMSLGLFYFVINVVILLLVSLVLGKHFYLTGFFFSVYSGNIYKCYECYYGEFNNKTINRKV